MPFATLEACLDAVQGACANVTGVKFAPIKPPEQPNAFPFVVTYPGAFTHHQGPAGMITYLYDVVVELHVARAELPNDVDIALPYAESIPSAVYGVLNSNAAAQGDGSGTFGALGWGIGPDGKPLVLTIGFSWTFGQVKIQKGIS